MFRGETFISREVTIKPKRKGRVLPAPLLQKQKFMQCMEAVSNGLATAVIACMPGQVQQCRSGGGEMPFSDAHCYSS
jgi:hypothetical protein